MLLRKSKLNNSYLLTLTFSTANFKFILYWWWSSRKASITILLMLFWRFIFIKFYGSNSGSSKREKSNCCISLHPSTDGWLSILDVITVQCNVTPRFFSAQECVMFTVLLDNSNLNKMSKRRSAAVARKKSSDGISQIFELTNTPVHQKSYEKHEINWDKCFAYQRDLTAKLQSSLEVQSTDPVKACQELGDRILKFESLNVLPVPIELMN